MSAQRGRGTCPACGRDTAVYGPDRLVWYHNRPGRRWPPCEGQGQPADRINHRQALIEIVDRIEGDGDAETARDLRAIIARTYGGAS